MCSSTESTCGNSWPALEDLSVHADHGIKHLTSAQLRPLFDPVERMFRRASEDREDRDIAQGGDPVIPPLARRDHAAIERQDHAKLARIIHDGDGL